MSRATSFERITLGPPELGIVVLVCSDCGALSTERSSRKHSQWHDAQRSGGGDASALSSIREQFAAPLPVAVVCRFSDQFRDWCRENGRDPRDPALVMVTEVEHAHAREFSQVVEAGNARPGVLFAARTRIREQRGGDASYWTEVPE